MGGALALAAGCDPRVVIGTRWTDNDASSGGTAVVEPPPSASAGVGGMPSDTELGGGAPSSAGAAGDGGDAGAASSSTPIWCAVAPWLEGRVTFTGESGTFIPAGSYRLSYEGGAQIHDRSLGYEVTDHYYGRGSIEAGHHVFGGDSPETGASSLWLIDDGLVGGDSVADVEEKNRGYSWPTLDHAGGELFVTLYDDYFGDNSGPGTLLCVRPLD